MNLTCRRPGAALLATAASSPSAVPSGRPIRLEHRRRYSAANCPKAQASDTDYVRAIEEAFAAENVAIAEVGAWCNMLDPDADKRGTNLDYAIERMALAGAVGARRPVDYAGSYNRNVPSGPDPRNVTREFFDATVENCRKIIDAIQPKRSVFTIEMMGCNLPDSPGAYLEPIKAVDRIYGIPSAPLILEHLKSREEYDEGRAYIQRAGRDVGVTFA